MFAKLFRGCRGESRSKSPSIKLKQALQKLAEKEIVLQKKISREVQRAKDFTKTKNKQAALECLKRKKFYEVQIEHIGSFQLHVHNQEKKLPQKSPVPCRKLQTMTSKSN